jgi:hypothetical protein
MNVSMKMGLTLVVSFLMTVASSAAFAAGNAGNRAIKSMNHPDSTRVLVEANNTIWLNPDACDKSNQVVLAAGQLNSYRIYQEMLAMLMTAHASERRVEIRTNGCLGVNGTSYPIVAQVKLL